MPRGPRLDYPGALHHLIVRGIERGAIFRSDHDRTVFLERLATLVLDSQASLYAWALMPNHAHALLRTGTMPLSRLALRWFGPYAGAFNRTHRRVGYLFQNRFKNILVEEERYFLELVRYIHLNPVGSRLPVRLDSLDQYPWTGHAVLLGHRSFPAQDTAAVLNRFGATLDRARQAYCEFVQQGVTSGPQPDLDGGGLRRSAGSWQVRERWAFDERILGSGDFVETVLQQLDGKPPPLVRDAPTVIGSLCERQPTACGPPAPSV
jgi:putative transposase